LGEEVRRIVVLVMVTFLIVGLLALTSNNQFGEGNPEIKLLLETDKPVYKLGEDIFITLTNIGSQTIQWVGLWPPFDVYAHPSGELVCRAMDCFCIFTLAAVESMTHNLSEWFLFGGVIAESGTYVAVDNQGWGLSAYFTIVDAEIIVPDDYLTIQEAINAASGGDTIFVRNGTYYETVAVNKSVSLVGESKAATAVDGGGVGTVIDVVSDNVTVSGFEIRNCSMTWEDWGIVLNHSSKSIVNGNIIKAVYAICVLGGFGNQVTDNSIVGDSGSCVFNGLQLADSSGNIVRHNNLSLDCHSAITMHNSTNNHITFNYISGHFVPFPFTLETSHNNSIVGNTMWQPAPLFGGHVHFVESSGNDLYHNAFLADEGPNTMSIDELSVNNWDNGCEGNYWSSYSDSDLEGDGIGDTPHTIDESNQDNLPLMNPYWNPGDIDHDLDVDIFDAVRCGIAYGSTPSDSNWNPHCDIAEPYGIINISDIVMIASSYGEECTPLP